MCKVQDVIDILEEMFPIGLAEDWDNVGFHFGHRDWTVDTLMVALDPSGDVVQEAADKKADMLVTHHPLIYRPIQSVDFGTTVGSIVETCAREKIAVYCAHTNMDAAIGGVNDMLAERIGLVSTIPLNHRDPSEIGLGRFGALPDRVRLDDFARSVGKSFGLKQLRISGDLSKWIKKVAICSGSGGSLIDLCIDSGADVFVSGDIKYHEARRLEEAGIGLVDIGHFASEHILVQSLAERMKTEFHKRGWTIRVAAASVEKDPFILIDVSMSNLP